MISVSPPFQLATKVPVLDSSNEIAPVENPIATKVSDWLTAMTRIEPIQNGINFDQFEIAGHVLPVKLALDFHVCKS